MANSYTPEEIAELKAREADEIKRLGQATVETRMALLDMAAGTKGLTETLTKGFGSLGTSAMGLTKQLANGETGASVFNKSINSVSNALGDLVGLIPYVGKGLKTLVKGAGEYTEAVNEHADRLYKTYQELSQVGANAAAGVSGMYDNIKRMNYDSKNELGVFAALVNESAGTLSSFGKTVGDGLNEVTKISEVLQKGNYGREFADMGIGVNEINKGIIGFTKMQILTGGRQRMTTDELITASQNYIKEVDLLAKITGKNRSQQEQSRESAMAEERYAGLTYELQQRAKMGDELAKSQLTTNDRIQQQLEKDAPGLRKGFLNILSGTINTKEAKEMTLAMPRAAAVAQKKFFTQAEFEAAVLEDLGRSLNGTGDQIVGAGPKLAQIGAFGNTFGNLGEQIKYFATLQQGTFEQREALAKKNQAVTDKATQNLPDINIQNRKSRDTLQDLLQLGVVPVTNAMNTAAGATNGLVTAFEEAAKKLGVDIKKREPQAPYEQAPARPAPERPVPARPVPARPAPEQPVPLRPAPERPRPSDTTTVEERIIQVESGGRNIPNGSGPGGRPTSSAYGLAQITSGTFETLASRAKPGNPLYGKTFEDMKADVDLQRKALSQLTASNRAQLAAAKVSTSDAAIYLAHFLGAAGATKVLQQPDSAPLSSALTPDQIRANAQLLSTMRNIGDLKDWADKKMGGGGYAPAAPMPVEKKPTELPQLVEKKAVEPPKLVEKKAVEPPQLVEKKPTEPPKLVEKKPTEPPKLVEKKAAEPLKPVETKVIEPPRLDEPKAAEPPKPIEPKVTETLKPLDKKTAELPASLKPVDKKTAELPALPKSAETKSAELPALTKPAETKTAELSSLPKSAEKKTAELSADPVPARPVTLPLTKSAAALEIDSKTMLPKQPLVPPVAPIPQENGGIIRATPGGVNVLAAEAGKNEAFVPLPDGKSIPVQIARNEEQMNLMSAQLERLDQLVRIMQNQVGVSEKLLKYAQ
jgi:hypothetical protein